MRLDSKDFSFQAQAEARKRRQLEVPPLRRKKPSWKITESDKQKPEPWLVEFDSAGRICRMTETTPPTIPSNAPNYPSARSRFEILLTEACLVGGHHVEPGCLIECFSHSAGGLFARGKIQAETKNAF